MPPSTNSMTPLLSLIHIFFSFRSRKIWELCFPGSGSSAMDKIIVGIAEGKVARENQVLISYALGLSLIHI